MNLVPQVPANYRPLLATGPADSRPGGPAGTHPAGRGDRRPPRRRGVAELAAGFAALFLEVEAGRRPRAHLAAIMTPMLYARLSDVWVRGGSPGCLLGVRVTGATAAGVDLVALVRRGSRCGAVGLHMTVTPRGWMVDDVALPEHGPLPLPPYPVPVTDDDAADGLDPIPSPVVRRRVPAAAAHDCTHRAAPE